MTYRVKVSARAQRDLKRLFETLDAQQSAQAAQWFNGLETAILSLNNSPSRCPVTKENPNLRQLLYSSQSYIYRVIFEIDSENAVVTILHIRHGSRN